jgi:hypothetical protein
MPILFLKNTDWNEKLNVYVIENEQLTGELSVFRAAENHLNESKPSNSTVWTILRALCKDVT